MTDRDEEGLGNTDLVERLIAQAERMAMPSDLAERVDRRRRSIRRRRRVGRVAGATVLIIGLVGIGLLASNVGRSSRLQVANSPEVELSAAIDSALSRSCQCESAGFEGETVDGVRTDAIIWLVVGVGDDRVARIQAELDAAPGVVDQRFVGLEETYAEFSAYFADKPEIIELVEPKQLPMSIRVELAADSDISWTKNLPGVDEVERAGEACAARCGQD